MAIYHCSVKIISRSVGRSAVAASAYRSGEKLYNDYDGLTHDYTRKSGVVYSDVMLCENAPEEYKDREKLWNEVEKIEKSKGAQLAREYEIALPNELTTQEQIELVRDYVKDNFVSNGMCADFSIHSGGHGHEITDEQDYDDEFKDKSIGKSNPHAHIMLTMRSIDEDGKWQSKSRKEYILDENGNKQYDKKKQTYKCKTVKTTNWDSKEFLKFCREDLADKINSRLETKGIGERVDHRSYEEQGVDKTPTIHLGKYATKIERKGEKSKMGDINREIAEQNKIVLQLKEELRLLELETKEFNLKKDEEQKADEVLQEERKKEEEAKTAEEAKRKEQLKKEELRKLEARKEALLKEYEYQKKLLENKSREYDIINNKIKNDDVPKREQGKSYNQSFAEVKQELAEMKKDINTRLDKLESVRLEIHELNLLIQEKQYNKEELGFFHAKEKEKLDKEIEYLEKHRIGKIEKYEKVEKSFNTLESDQDQYKKYSQLNQHTNYEIIAARGKIKDLEQRQNEFNKVTAELKEKREQRENLGIFKSKEKKQLDKDIKDLEKREKAKVDSLKNDYGIAFDEVDNAISKSKDNLDDLTQVQQKAETLEKGVYNRIRDAKERQQALEQSKEMEKNNERSR